jgi:hypothetical protein
LDAELALNADFAKVTESNHPSHRHWHHLRWRLTCQQDRLLFRHW